MDPQAGGPEHSPRPDRAASGSRRASGFSGEATRTRLWLPLAIFAAAAGYGAFQLSAQQHPAAPPPAAPAPILPVPIASPPVEVPAPPAAAAAAVAPAAPARQEARAALPEPPAAPPPSEIVDAPSAVAPESDRLSPEVVSRLFGRSGGGFVPFEPAPLPPGNAASPAKSGDCADCTRAVADSGRMQTAPGTVVVTSDKFIGRCKDGAYIYSMTNVSRQLLHGRLVSRDGQYWVATLPPGETIEIKSRTWIPGMDGRDFVGTWADTPAERH